MLVERWAACAGRVRGSAEATSASRGASRLRVFSAAGDTRRIRRRRFTAWLLALAFPLMLIGSDVLGHNSLGMIPLFLAWAATGRHLWHTIPTPAHGPEPARANQRNATA